MKQAYFAAIHIAAAFFLLFFAVNTEAYSGGYAGNCDGCHGDFTGSVSPKGSTFPGDDKHQMHRANGEMNTECLLCHTSVGDNPLLGSSTGTGNNTGYGCVGCHGRLEDAGNDSVSAGLGAGLRQHHQNSGITACSGCHTDAVPANYTPVGEDVRPPYYGTADTNADMSCNPTLAAGVNENWTIGDTEGVDNDGDSLYDFAADSDCTPVVPTPGDLNFDGKADILWRNGTTGQNWAYLMNADQIDQSIGINTVPTAWQIVGNGDYDNDDDADILWRNSSTGENWMYLMDGALIDSSERVITVPTDWQVAGNGDYDGDGDSDILWRNSVTGQNWMYLMNGSLVQSSMVVVWDSVFTIPTVWEVAGNGDYDGDTKADILWRNSSTGESWIYFMNGATVTNSVRVNTVPTVWELVGNGDYDGDGDADILWRNSSTGENWMYLMNGATIDNSLRVNTISDTLWKVAGSGDYNGDTKSDILWRNSSTGQNWLYLMNGATIDNSLGVNTVSDTAWQIVNVD